MSDQVWVEIGDGVSIGIDRDEAMSLDRAGFVALFKRTVYPPPGFRARRRWKREADQWADRQIAARADSQPKETTDCRHGKRIGTEHCNECQIAGFCDCPECRDNA